MDTQKNAYRQQFLIEARDILDAVAAATLAAESDPANSELLNAIGRSAWVRDEALMDAVTAVSGSGPAYVFNLVEAMAHRPMREEDYQAWLAVRIIGEAATRTGSGDPARLREHILSPEFEVAGFKGQKLTIRDWDHQLRQPILLATPMVTASVSPQDQYLHQSSALDTLGIDRPETECKF